MKKWHIEIVLHNGMRVIIVEESNKKIMKMFEEASKLQKKEK